MEFLLNKMYKKGFLTNISVEEGMLSNEIIIESKNYWGKIISGFFHIDSLNKGKLEVKVITQQEDKAMIIPQGGYFLEEDQDKRVIVNKRNLIYFN